MLALIQRVKQAEVKVADNIISRINAGICILLGIGSNDSEADVDYLIKRILALKFFADATGKFALGFKDQMQPRPEILVISQFTLYADLNRGSKPSFTKAMSPDKALPLYDNFCKKLSQTGFTVKTGKFGAYMDVELVNDGPVTFMLSSDKINK